MQQQWRGCLDPDCLDPGPADFGLALILTLAASTMAALTLGLLTLQREANRLVEEFMLLANMEAARAIADAFGDRHATPLVASLWLIVSAACRPTSQSHSPCSPPGSA